MSLASRPASRWAVSARTNGEVLTAGISRSELELTVLGIPGGFSQLEIEGWLHDLAGVAVETSRADSRARAIPALMHHALTGLLFSHAELWDKLEAPRPCSSAFVDLPEGAAFGWVGDARVHVLVDGDPVEPQWVRVRDEAGREGRAAVFATGSDVVVTLEYWPQGEDGGVAPASLEAEWVGASGAAVQDQEWQPAEPPPVEPSAEVSPAWFASAAVETAGVEPPHAAAPAEVARVSESERAPAQESVPGPAREPEFEPAVLERSATELAQASAPFELYPELPESLPMQQPGLAHSAIELQREASPGRPLAASAVPELVVPIARAPEVPSESFDALTDDARESREPVEQEAHKVPHPVARWLARVMKWGRPESPAPEHESAAAPLEAAPVSAYDALLSGSVPPTSLEQTAFDLPASAGARPAVASAAPPQAGQVPATLRPAGIAEILGAHATVTSSPHAAPPAPPPATPLVLEPAAPGAASSVSSPSGSIAINEKLQALLREIEAAEAGAMPVLAPELPGDAARRPLEIDHEPVGADESFGIPPLPSSLTLGPPEEDRVTAIPQLPPSRVVAYPPPPRPVAAPPQQAASVVPPAPVEPLPPAVTPVPMPSAAAEPVTQPVESVPVAPPVLRVSLPSRGPGEFEPVTVERVETEPIAPAAFERTEPAAPVETAAEAADAEPLFPLVTRRARSLEGPETFARPKPQLPRGTALWVAGVVAVFVVGWLVGGFSNPSADRGGPVMAALRAVGIGGAHFTVNVNSSPGGAQIEIDGKAQSTRTPATLELPPGDHVVRLVLPGLGAVEVPVKGRKGEKLSIDEPLNGSLEILDADTKVPISVSIDGKPAGYAPLRVESIAPGLHEVGFSGPGMPAWAQTVQVDVRGEARLIARPMTAPANGVIQAQATLNDERGASPLSGAQVYVDGELRGVTPLSVELPRGPHSLRVTWRGETAPIQVIDLPGGNQRFASFQFGLDLESPRLTPIGSTKSFATGQPKVVSASVEGLSPGDVHEAWMHVRTPEGLWRRYAMTILRGAGGLVVTSVFPDNVFDKQGNTRWYVRVVSPQGDEAFSEIQRSSLVAPGAGRQQP